MYNISICNLAYFGGIIIYETKALTLVLVVVVVVLRKEP